MMRLPYVLLLLFVCSAVGGCGGSEPVRVLVFTGTEGFRHGSTEAGIEAIRAVGTELGFEVESSDSASVFTEPILRGYRAVVFLNTSGDVLDFHQQAAFERFIQAGGGFVGIHGAADTEKEWDWYGRLIGAYDAEPLSEHPRMTSALLTVGAEHPATDSVPSPWQQTDEWYRMDVVNPDMNVLMRVEDERLPGGSQPAAWYHEFDGGRVFYTALGHSPEVFEARVFRNHLKGGFEYVLGDREPLDFSRATTRQMPEENRFNRIVLADSLNEPTELELLGNGKVIFTERRGALKMYDPESGTVRTIAQLDVHTEFEDGLMGMALDPDYEENDWIFLYYSPAGDEPKQHLSRFEFRNDSLITESEVVVLVVPTQREECCHTGGSIEFGPDGNLFLSTGDDTNPFQSDGYAPIDERPGRQPFDAQGTSANTNDLRGKILRITPRPDGTYTIPDGNLFPEGTEGARPEIYVMGNRNPYRIHIDQKTGFLYWGEVGPDAGEDDAERGPRGHDEINQARRAGFFGWPLFVGDNKAYREYDFASGQAGPAFDAGAPINDSPNNTGLGELPPAQPAYIWYPYAESPEFPIVGTGGRNAMAGPVFYSDMFSSADVTFPDYYDRKLFVYDWIRGWILVATMSEAGDLLRLEPFMPATRWNNPIDMAFDEHGALYVLEYGTGWFKLNPDARLNRVEFNPGNRAPDAAITADTTVGAVPLTVTFSAADSRDVDGDELAYTWKVGDGEEDRTDEPTYTHTFEEAGIYGVVLTVEDGDGEQARDEIEVRAGNAPPRVQFKITGNRSFYWDGRELEYDVQVSDPEEGVVREDSVRTNAVYVTFDFMEQGFDTEMMELGHQEGPQPHAEGLRMIQESDCQACHSAAARSVGPSYVDVALRYRDRPDAVQYLSAKIIQGGGGVWGEQAMAAHPQLSDEEASMMVEYILSLADDSTAAGGLPLQGRFTTEEHVGEERQGTYVLQARYTDAGANGAPPATGQALVVLRNPRLEAERFDGSRGVGVQQEDSISFVKNIYDDSHIVFRDVDLSDIEEVRYKLRFIPLHSWGGRIEIRLDGPTGALVSTARAEADSVRTVDREVTAEVVPTAGRNDLYFVFRNDRGVTPEALFLLDWIEFVPGAARPEPPS